MTLKIITNNVPRLLLYGYELTPEQKSDFDYIDDIDSHPFVIFKGNVYDIGEFMRTPSHNSPFTEWHGYRSDSYFSGVLIKYCDGGPWYDGDRVIMGWYIS